MAGSLALAVIVALAPALADARPSTCTLPDVTLGPACVGDTATGTARFDGPAFVVGYEPPDAPFSVGGLRVEGPTGTRAVAFPVALAAGEAVVLDVAVPLASADRLHGRITWYVSGADDSSCSADLFAEAPACGSDPRQPCAGTRCVAGACVPVGDGGPCGSACQSGGTCVSGSCIGGTVPDCDDGNPCTTDLCDAERGCVHVAGGGACDDGDPCTTGDRCRSGVCRGDPIRCTDGLACTDDRCVDGQCQFVPVDARCGDGDCSSGVCRPDDPDADARGCVVQPVTEGGACTDDGFSCTDDVCRGGACLHVPVDARCTSSADCREATCDPGRRGANEAGCVPGGERVDGTLCAEDGDPCSDDTCHGGTCDHVRIAGWQACSPVADSFRQALALAALARGLETAVAVMPADAAAASGHGMLAPLSEAERDLSAAATTLAGRDPAAALDAGPGETAAATRARAAYTHVATTPRQVRAFLAAAHGDRLRSTLGGVGTRDLRRRGTLLLRGTKTLKAQLRRLQQVPRTFVR